MQCWFQTDDVVIMISESGCWEQAYADLYQRLVSVSDLRGRGGELARDVRSPTSGSNFFHFHSVFGKKMANNRLAPPAWRLAPQPRLGNSRCATGYAIRCVL